MRNRIVFMALSAGLTLPMAVMAALPESPPPGWDRALTAVQTHWQKKHPDDLIVSIKRFSLFMDSEGDWFEVTYPFELAVKRKGVAQVFKVGARYRKPTPSSPWAFTGINEDAGERINKAEVAQPLLDSKDARLFRALQDRDFAAVQAALAAGGRVEAKNENGSRALLVAALGGNAKIVKLLLEKGAEVNATSDFSGDTALMGALDKPGNWEVAKLLLDQGADVNAVDAYGATVLVAAVIGQNAKIVKLLLDSGAKVNAKNKDGLTALMMVADAEIANLLLERGAEVNAKESSGATALISASFNGRLEVAKVFLEKGAEVNAKEDKGRTALMVAVEAGHSKVVKLLLEKGAEVNAKDTKARTALMTAAEKGDLEVVKLLLEKGAEVNARDAEGKTAIKIADEHFHGNIVSYLQKRGESDSSGSSAQTATPVAASPSPPTSKPGLDAQTCGDPCALLTLYAYDDLTTNACKICKKHDRTFCDMDFPFNDVPSCDAYDELRNCVFARFGYVFSKPKWQQQFGKMPWYRPDPTFTEAKLPPVAKANVQKLKDLKAKHQGCQ